MSLNQFKYGILATRPKTLTAAVVPVVAATALTLALGYQIQWWISLLALGASLCIQIATNLINDYVDFEKGADRDDRLGPLRVTHAGHFTTQQVRLAAILFVILALAQGIPLVLHGGMVILLIGFISLILAYGYTGGPFPLAYRGLGDLFVILFFGIIAVSGMVYLQTRTWPLAGFILGLQIGCHCAVLIAINNLRDIESDKRAGKKTLPVRFGKNFAKFEIAALCVLPFLLQIYWWQNLGWWKVTVIGFIAFPLAIKIIRQVQLTEPSTKYNRFLAQSAGLHLIFGLLVSLGMIL